MPHSDRHAAVQLLSDVLTTLRKAVEQLPDLNTEERDTLIDILTANDLHTAAMATALKVLQRAVKDAAAWREVEAANTIIKELRDKLRLVETGWQDVWFWTGNPEEDEVQTLTCPVVLEADTMRALLDKLHVSLRDASCHRAQTATRFTTCVCGKPVNDAHRLVAAYGAWCCPDRLSAGAAALTPEAPVEASALSASEPLDRDALLELANGRIEQQRQQALAQARELADKVAEVKRLRTTIGRFEDEMFELRRILGKHYTASTSLKQAVQAYVASELKLHGEDVQSLLTEALTRLSSPRVAR